MNYIFIITGIIGVFLFIFLIGLLIYSLLLFIRFANLGIEVFTIYTKRNSLKDS